MVRHTHQGDAKQGVVRGTVSAAAESVSVGLTRGRGHGRYPTQCGECGLTVHPVRIGPSGDQQLCGGVRADAVRRPQPGIRVGHEGFDLGLEGLGLGFEELHSLGEHLGRGEHRLRPRVALWVGAAPGDRLDHLQYR
jgi:hypothetical protein